jgi:hypothetical protein
LIGSLLAAIVFKAVLAVHTALISIGELVRMESLNGASIEGVD